MSIKKYHNVPLFRNGCLQNFAVCRVGPQHLADNFEKELKMKPIFGLGGAILEVK